jgi:prolipoprotein diacylglyceryltransferase
MFPTLSLGPISLPAPELILIIGFWIGITLASNKASQFSINSVVLDNLIWICLIAGLLGARLSFIARFPAAFKGNILSILSPNPAFLDPLSGFLIATAAGFIYLTQKQIPLRKVLDSTTLFLACLFAAIHLSNFASGDQFGIPSNLPWSISLWQENRHPVQLYYLMASLIILGWIIFTNHSNQKISIFYKFIAYTSAYLLFLSVFQEYQGPGLFSLRLDQLGYWLVLLMSLYGINHQINKTGDNQ